MSNYLFISSRGPYESPDTNRFLELVESTRGRHHRTTLLLIQNGVLSTRKGAQFSSFYQKLTKSGVAVLADSFPLRERAISTLADGVKVTTIEQVIDLMVEPATKAIWH